MSNATETMTEGDIRRDERARLAALVRDNVSTFADFAADKRAAVLLVALAIDL